MAMLWALAQMLGCCQTERVLHALIQQLVIARAISGLRIE
jgi:hypothetical protein